MNASQKAKELFLNAAEKANPAERQAYLDAACGDDAGLRREVEDLLGHHEQLGSFLQAPASPQPQTLDLAIAERPGDVIGPYKLIEPIGEGGMGSVWMTQQTEPVKRLVALKLIKPGMDSKQVIARFEAERQALALMDHPNIAKVLDAGVSPDGRPYFVMELVKGVPITRYCDEHRLTPRQRLELFIPVCQAIQHAHQKGIIHRDVKPSNVLVALYDDKPVPKVIDFGVAKAVGQPLTEQTLQTGFGAVVGTVEYMSPEQASFNQLDIDTRSDIYSLGVLLYELLTGTTPLERKRVQESGLLEALRIIREEEVPTLSNRLSTTAELPAIAANRGTEPAKLTKLVRGELDWIVMKALEKDRNRRYETANGFAMDVQRYLADEPVQARPPSAWYRLRKFVRRNRGAVLATSLIVLALVGGMIGTAWQAVRAESARQAEVEQRKQAQASEQKAITAADAERKANEHAQKRLRQIEKQAGALTSVFADLDPRAEEKLGKPLQIILGERLLRVAAMLEGDEVGDPLLVARLQDRLGQSLINLGLTEKAIPLFQKARATRAAILGADHLDTVRTLGNLAEAFRVAGEADRALPLLDEAFRSLKAQLGPDHPDTLASMSNLALAYKDAGKYRQALPLAEQCLNLARNARGPEHPDTLTAMNNLAVIYDYAGKWELALPLWEQTLKLRKARLGEDHPATLNTMANLAGAYGTAGKLDDALRLHQEVLRLTKAKLGPDHPETLRSMNNLATAYQKAGKLNEALVLLDETLKLMKARLGPYHPTTLKTMNNLGFAYRDLGKLDEALPLLEETLRLRKARLGADHPDTLRSMNSLAGVYRVVGKLSKAVLLLEDALRLRKAKLGADHPDILRSMNDLALAYQAAGKLDQAVALWEQAVPLMKARMGVDHPNTLVTMDNLALGYQSAGKLDKAIPLHEEVLQLMKAKLGEDHPDTLLCRNSLAVAYGAANRLDKALPLYEETLRLMKAKLGPDHPDTLISINNLAMGYHAAGKLDQALPLFLEAATGIEKRQFMHQNANRIVGNLVACHEQLRQFDKAEAWRRKWLAVVKEESGVTSLPYATELAGLGWNLLQQNKPLEAERVLREALAICEKKEPQAWTTANTRSLLGKALLGQEKYADAESQLLAAYEGLKANERDIPAENKHVLANTIRQIIQLYEAWQKPDKAREWRAKLPVKGPK